MLPETSCPECLGVGFFGNNGPVVESQCGRCNGTGVLVEDSLYVSCFATMRKDVGREIFWKMEERRQRG